MNRQQRVQKQALKMQKSDALGAKTGETCSDTISRQAAIDAVCMEWCGVKHQDCKHQFDVKKDDYYWCDGCETALRTLPDLPSVQPEPERTMEEFIYGQDMGNPEDGSL